MEADELAAGEMFLLSTACVCLAMLVAGKRRKLNSGDAILFSGIRVSTMLMCQAQVEAENSLEPAVTLRKLLSASEL